MNTPAWSPYRESLIAARPVSKLSTLWSTSTGPNTSSRSTSASWRTSESTVGSRFAPERGEPPESTFAPPSTASATHDSTRAAASALIIGPTLHAGSFGSPEGSARTWSVIRSAMSANAPASM